MGKHVYRRRQLKGYFEGMVINVLVYIKGLKYVECLSVIDLSIHLSVRGEPREQMSTTDDGIQVDDAHVPVGMTTGVLRFDDPQPGGTVGLSANHSIPMDEGAWILHAGKRELKEKVNTGYQ